MPVKNINGVEIFYEEKGNPESERTLVFLNGVMASTNSWDLMVPFFDQKGYRIVLHDFRGQTKSEKPDTPFGFNDHADDLFALMKKLKIVNADIIGTSYGGEVALYFACRYPEKVSSLTIIDSVSELSPLLEVVVKSWITAAESGKGSSFYSLLVPWLFSSRFIDNNRDMLSQRAAAMDDIPDSYFKGQKALYRSFLDIDITDRLEKIEAPSLILCGEEDILKPKFFSKIMADRIPDSRIAVIPECGHVAIFEKPGELCFMISGFLESLR